jgi:hypothetical protein
MVGQPARQFAQQVAIGENAGQGRKILQCARRADLHGEPPARLVVADHRRHGFADAKERAILQGARALFRLDAVVREQGTIDILAQRFGLGRDQIACDPFPDRLKRHAREPPGALVIGGIVDEERLDRREEYARGVAHARRRRLAFDTDGAAQLLQDEFVAGRFFAAHNAALELGDQHGARLRLQRPQIIAQPFDGLSVARHPGHHSVRKASSYL